MEQESQLAKKLSSMYEEIGRVPKRGRNEYQGYDYIMEPDLVDHVRPLLAEKDIFVYPSVTHQQVKELSSGKLLTTVEMEFTIVDGSTGESVVVKSQGQGYDPSDKGVYKAITGANKYFLYKLLQIAAGDDPEEDVGHGEETAKRAKEDARSSDPRPPSDKQVDYLFDLMDNDYREAYLIRLCEKYGIEAPIWEFTDGEIKKHIKENLTSSQVSDVIDKLKGGKTQEQPPY